MQWYYANNGQRQGPVNEDEFQRLVSTAVIRDDTLVWRDGLGDWQPYAKVRPVPVASALPPVATASSAASGESPVGGDGAVPVAAGANEAPPVMEPTEVCAVSGKRFPKREMVQYEGRWVSALHRDEFFQRIREGVALPGENIVPGPYGYGGFWRRLVANFIDGLAMGVVGIPVNMLLAYATIGTVNYFLYKGTNFGGFIAFQALSMVAGLVIGLSYSVYFIRRYQATPGKMVMGLKLLRADGAPLSAGRIIGRHFAHVVSTLTAFIGYIMAGFDDQKRALHDYMCDTRVIKTRR